MGGLFTMLTPHPEHHFESWMREVVRLETELGYHQWVLAQIELNS